MNFRRIFLELTAYASACADAPYYMCLRSLLRMLTLPIRHAHAPYYKSVRWRCNEKQCGVRSPATVFAL